MKSSGVGWRKELHAEQKERPKHEDQLREGAVCHVLVVQSHRDSGRRERASCQTAGVSIVSPRENDQQFEKARARDNMEEELTGVFGESSEELVERERQGDAGKEVTRARARKAVMARATRR